VTNTGPNRLLICRLFLFGLVISLVLRVSPAARATPEPTSAPERTLGPSSVPTPSSESARPLQLPITVPPSASPIRLILDSGSELKDIAELVRAFTGFAWLIFLACLVLVFKKDIRDILPRIRRGKFLGQEIEVDVQLGHLAVAAEETRRQTIVESPASDTAETKPGASEPDSIDSILSEAAKSPQAALIRLAAEIETEAIRILASVGRLGGRANVPIMEALRELEVQYGGLPSSVIPAMKLFSDVRNRIVHGGGATNDQNLQAIDSGITILRALRAIPREVNVVKHPSVPIYRDRECQRPYTDAHGVVLEKQSPGGTRQTTVIFPTTKTHFFKGKAVAWEWDLGLTFGPAWYREPETQEIKQGWASSAEFIGRNLDKI
jgi:hypothetical protein